MFRRKEEVNHPDAALERLDYLADDLCQNQV
jgi:hypothetical protein